MSKFEKVSLTQWRESIIKTLKLNEQDITPEVSAEIDALYDNIQLPKRSTKFSAGYDFYLPIPAMFSTTATLVPTGIRWVCDETDSNQVLLIVPRSSLGTKFNLRLTNTVGVIDADYANSDNEGHIFASIVANDGTNIVANERFIQGIIVNYNTIGDTISTERNGGFGSTNEVK